MEPIRVKKPLAITALTLLVGLVFASPMRAFWEWSRSEQVVMTVFLLLSVLWAAMMLVLVSVLLNRSPSNRRTLLLLVFLGGEAAMMFMLPRLNAVKGRSIDTPAIAFLREHQGLARVYTMGPISPNYGAYFGVRLLDYIALPVPRLWAQYVDAHLLPDVVVPGGYPGQNFNPQAQLPGVAEAALRTNLANYQEMGVLYVVTSPGASPVSRPEQTPPAPSKAVRIAAWIRSLTDRPGGPKLLHVFAADLLKRLPSPPLNPQGGPALDSLRTSEEDPSARALGIQLVYQDAVLWIWELPHPAPYYEILPGATCELAPSSDAAVQANCTGPALLERRELYMPGWSAHVGARETAVRQNGVFQTVELPAGESEVHFRFTPPGMLWAWLASGAGAAVLLLLGVRAPSRLGNQDVQRG